MNPSYERITLQEWDQLTDLSGYYHVIYNDKFEFYYVNGRYHRKDGPAVIEHGVREVWFEFGRMHSSCGPAVTWNDGRKEYWLNNVRLSRNEWLDCLSREDLAYAMSFSENFK